MFKVIDRRNCSSLTAVYLCAGCQVNKQTTAKWVRVEMRARTWPRASTSAPIPHQHGPPPSLLYTVTHAAVAPGTTNRNTAILIFLLSQRNIDTVVQCFHFSHYSKQNHGMALLVSLFLGTVQSAGIMLCCLSWTFPFRPQKKTNTTKIRFAKHVLFFKKSLYVYLEKAVAALSYVHFKCCFSCYLLNNFHVGRTSGLGLKCKWLLSAFTPASNDSTVITCVCGNQLWLADMKTQHQTTP